MLPKAKIGLSGNLFWQKGRLPVTFLLFIHKLSKHPCNLQCYKSPNFKKDKIIYSVPVDKLEFRFFTHDRKAETLSLFWNRDWKRFRVIYELTSKPVWIGKTLEIQSWYVNYIFTVMRDPPTVYSMNRDFYWENRCNVLKTGLFPLLCNVTESIEHYVLYLTMLDLCDLCDSFGNWHKLKRKAVTLLLSFVKGSANEMLAYCKMNKSFLVTAIHGCTGGKCQSSQNVAKKWSILNNSIPLWGLQSGWSRSCWKLTAMFVLFGL